MLADWAVINAGPLVALSLADRLDLLPALFGKFWITGTWVIRPIPDFIAATQANTTDRCSSRSLIGGAMLEHCPQSDSTHVRGF